MQRFAFYSGQTLVGHSDLEQGDPPMGVAFGQFHPAADYRLIADTCRCNHADQSGLALSVRTAQGVPITCAGVAILDYRDAFDGDEDYIEATVLGIGYPLYQQLFPERVVE